jgi:Family of unknown function (DUF5995)
MSAPLPPITNINTIDDVVNAIDGIVQWSIANVSRLGYFAALYRRITIAIRTACDQGLFQDNDRLRRLDVVFASRYFAALNGYFHPGQFAAPSHCWQVAFNGAQLPDPIIVQQMIAGVNAHIDLDLGIAAEQIAPGLALPGLRSDFFTVNAVLASQVTAVVGEIDELSPLLDAIYCLLMENEINLINDGLRVTRDSAWAFATELSLELPVLHGPTIKLHDLEVAKLGTLILHPPSFFETLVTRIAAQESRDVVHNIEVLNQLAQTPATIKTTL